MPSIALLLSSGLRTAKNKSDQLLRILMCRQVSQRVVFFHEISFYLSHWQLANVLSKGIKGGHLSLAFTVAYFIALLPHHPPLSPGNKWSPDISLCQTHRKYLCQRPALNDKQTPWKLVLVWSKTFSLFQYFASVLLNNSVKRLGHFCFANVCIPQIHLKTVFCVNRHQTVTRIRCNWSHFNQMYNPPFNTSHIWTQM